jgi:hypothetical protein
MTVVFCSGSLIILITYTLTSLVLSWLKPEIVIAMEAWWRHRLGVKHYPEHTIFAGRYLNILTLSILIFILVLILTGELRVE